MNPEFEKKQGEYSPEKGENGRDGYRSREGFSNFRGNGEQRDYRSQRSYNNRRPSYNDDKEGEFRPNGFGAGLRNNSDNRRPYSQRGSYSRRPEGYRPRYNNEENAEGAENQSYGYRQNRCSYNRQGGSYS